MCTDRFLSVAARTIYIQSLQYVSTDKGLGVLFYLALRRFHGCDIDKGVWMVAVRTRYTVYTISVLETEVWVVAARTIYIYIYIQSTPCVY